MSKYEDVQTYLRLHPASWLITGVAGFIGSNLLENLLRLNQRVVGLDNFSTGFQRNLDEVAKSVEPVQWNRFRFIKGDICEIADCRSACEGVDYVLHQAALGSVPRSIEKPLASHAANVTGFLNVLMAAREAGVRRLVYASSSSVYGDHPGLPKTEGSIGRPLSPYAATKLMAEYYSEVFLRAYGFTSVGLRYFNVFGPRQDPDGAYAAVIPKWFAARIRGDQIVINGDGRTSRDFCYIANVVQGNILAATMPHTGANGRLIYNIACGERVTLLELFEEINSCMLELNLFCHQSLPLHSPERAGDVKHSLADISSAILDLGYFPTHHLKRGLRESVNWYTAHH